MGDVNSDGALDLVVANDGQNVIYLNKNDRSGDFRPAMPFGEPEWTSDIEIGDLNGDGLLDLVVSHEPNFIYLNSRDGSSEFFDAIPFSGSESTNPKSIALGDVNGDGAPDILIGNIFSWEEDWVYLNGAHQAAGLGIGNTPYPKVTRPVATGNANFYSTPEILDDLPILVPYTLYDAEGDPAGYLRAFYSLDGGGFWRTAKEEGASGLTTSPNGMAHTFNWEISDLFGQSDNVVFRLNAYAQPAHGGNAGIYRYPNAVAGNIQRTYTSATTFPFRVRGTQVRVIQDERGVPAAIVYRQAENQESPAEPLGGVEQPFQTGGNGYLRGRERLKNNDNLTALWPASTTDNYILYYTSAAATRESLSVDTVTGTGVQTLTVSSDNKLVLFDLDVALEWDARKDAQYQEQLRFNLQRTSQLLFDWSDGQMALGDIRIFHDARRQTTPGFDPWLDSHIRIYATNAMRPSASVGGIISPTLLLSETVTIDGVDKVITYGPGQVQMGAIWNRYGESTSSLGDDWARALAHELGHYLLFLEDNYLGVNEEGMLVTIPAEGDDGKRCPGAMNDPYRESQSEFVPEADWDRFGCDATLSQRTMGRSDWQTIRQFYPLTAPEQWEANPGPATLPLAVTQLENHQPHPGRKHRGGAHLLAHLSRRQNLPAQPKRPSLSLPGRLADQPGPTDLGPGPGLGCTSGRPPLCLRAGERLSRLRADQSQS